MHEVLPRNAHNLMDRMTLPSLFIPGIKQYRKNIAWQIVKGFQVLPMVFLPQKHKCSGNLHQQSAANIADFPKKRTI